MSLPPERVTNDPNNADSRIFVGNIDLSITRRDLEEKFEKYGVLAVTVLKGYGFVQLGTPDDAQEAIERESGGMLKGRELVLKIVNQARGGQKRPGGGRPMRNISPSSQNNRHNNNNNNNNNIGGPRFGMAGRQMREDRAGSNNAAAGAGDRKRSRRDASPWRDRPHRGGDDFGGVVGGGGVSRGDLTINKSGVDCQLIVLNRESRRFAADVEERLLRCGLTVDTMIPPVMADLDHVMDQIGSRGTMFAILFQPLCELNGTVSLNILCSNPPEIYHNVPVDKAISLMTDNIGIGSGGSGGGFRKFLVPGGAGVGTGVGGAAVPGEIGSLMEMVLQDRQLSTIEYNILIRFLEDKRDNFNRNRGSALNMPSGPPKPVPPPVIGGLDPGRSQQQQHQQQQQQQQQLDLQQKIVTLMQAYSGGGQQMLDAASGGGLMGPAPGMTHGGGNAAMGPPRGVPAPGGPAGWNNRRF